MVLSYNPQNRLYQNRRKLYQRIVMNLEKTSIKTPLTPIDFMLCKQHDIQVWVKRDDLNHPLVQGNKWHKLFLNLQQAKQQNCTNLLTFGGAYSNHIAATAAAAKAEGFKSIGIIRGDELANNAHNWSQTLKQAATNGMQFTFVSRQRYKQRHDAEYIEQLSNEFPNSYVLPEGGSNALAILGFKNLMQQINQQNPDWTHLFCAVGTGATLAGLVTFANTEMAKNRPRNIVGIPVLKQGDYLKKDIETWIQQTQKSQNLSFDKQVQWQLLTQYHDGGYGKQSEKGQRFQQNFEQHTQILLDPVYTNKVAYALFDQIEQQQIEEGAKVILLHTGGLQGRPIDSN